MKNKKKIKLPLILIILILVISVGYALLTSEGSIHGWSTLADSKWDIHFTNLVVNEGSTDLSEEDSAAVITEDNTQVTYRVTLNKPGDFYEFTVDVKNFGTIDGMVNLLTSTMSIDGEEAVEIAEDKSNLPEYLDYSITYSDGTKIDKNHELKTGEYETYKVRVEFKKDIIADQLPTEVKTILFNITPEFVQADNNSVEREKPSPFITSTSTKGLGIMSYDIDYDKCVEEFSYMDDVDVYCRGEDINDNGYIYNIKQDIGYDTTYYEDLGIITNIKYGKVESYEINHDGCTNYLRNNGESDEEQIELFCTGNTATVFGEEQSIEELISSQIVDKSVFEAMNIINITYDEIPSPKTIIGYDGNIPKNIVIPKTINGGTVVGIEEEVFKDKGIESVTIPNTVEFIGRKAFDNNNLSKVTLEDNTIDVSYCAFGKKESIITNNLSEDYYCEQIYWALQDNDSDNKNETLVISDSEISGNEQGGFDGDTMFEPPCTGELCENHFPLVPWTINNLDDYVSNVIIEGAPMPIVTTSWFSDIGFHSSSFSANLENLDTSKVIDMTGMFYSTGRTATTFEIDGLSNWDTSKVADMRYMFTYTGNSASNWSIGDLSNWDTSKVTNMERMFHDAGRNATSWSIGDLNNWNTSKVIDMGHMFSSAGQNATTFNLDLSNWNTSKVRNMNQMFYYAGNKSTTWSIGDLSDWNTSQVTIMANMFAGTGANATTFNLDLSNWNTSHVTSMYDMFSYAGENATTINLDLSNWNTSNVTDMRYMFHNTGIYATNFRLDLSNWNTSKVKSMNNMFNGTGYSATTFKITIPKTNGNSISNDTSHMYGSTTSNYASPPSGRSFTLAST